LIVFGRATNTARKREKSARRRGVFDQWCTNLSRAVIASRVVRARFRQISQPFLSGKMLLARGQNTLQAEPQIATFPPVVHSEKIHRIWRVIDAPSFCLCARHRRSVAVSCARPNTGTAAAPSAAAAAAARGGGRAARR
jgi:hypothetical protein